MAEPQDIPQPNQEQPNQEHEAILQRSPFLKAFLDHPPIIGAAWLDDLEPLGKSIEGEIAAKLGNRWWATTLGPIAVMAEEQGVFDTRFLDDAKDKTQNPLFRLVKTLFLLGYAVGNRKDASSFSIPIIQKLSQHGVTHFPVPEGEQKNYWQRLFKTSLGIIETGAYIRNCTDKLNQSKETASQSDPFKDFIQGLESIDKLPTDN